MNPSDWNSRTELLIGKEALEVLRQKHVLVAGLGGVGAYAAEQLCRAGIGNLTIIDGDEVTASNRNRQLLALKSVEGQRKASLMATRLKDINPELNLRVIDEYLANDRIDDVLSQHFDYVVDAIDTLTPKAFFIIECVKNNLRLVSSMGAGGKMNPALIEVGDLSKSHGCKLAFYIRKRLQKFGIRSGFQVVFSPEPINKEQVVLVEAERNKKSMVGTISYMPAIFGCYCASVVIRDLLAHKDDDSILPIEP